MESIRNCQTIVVYQITLLPKTLTIESLQLYSVQGCWLAPLLSFKGPLLSVDVSVCVSAILMLNNTQKLSDLHVHAQ